MNRQTRRTASPSTEVRLTEAARAQAQGFPPGYRPSAPAAPNAMYYATAGQQTTTSSPARPTASQSQGGLQQGGGFPPLGGGLSRGPPGLARSSETGDFPALAGSHTSSYATQAQQPNAPSTSSHHLQQGGLVPPPPPPGIRTSPGQYANGLPNDHPRDDFPQLSQAEAKDRVTAFMRSQASQSPPSLANGTTTASTSATPSTNPALPLSGAPTIDSWGRSNSPNRPLEPVIRPVQQIMSSPVDKWGLKALLYEIKTSMAKTDRGLMLFGEELSELGIDIAGEDPLFPTFVTPWTDSSKMGHLLRIEEQYHLPACYNVVAPPVQTKIPNFADETLFYAFYTSPQDVLQLEVAEELYNRGWRYHTELQVWLTSPTVLSTPPDQHGGPTWLRGPFVVFDPRTYARTKTADEFMIDASLLEATRSAGAIVQEEQEKGANGTSAAGGVGGNGSGNGNGVGAASAGGASTAAAGGGAGAYSR